MAGLFIRWSQALRTVWDYLRLPGYFRSRRPVCRKGGREESFGREDDFWAAVFRRAGPGSGSGPIVRPGTRVSLRGFYPTDWVPRVPGLYFRADTAKLRQRARDHIIETGEDFEVYDHNGKSLRVLGGIATVRLLPHLDARLVSLTKSGWAYCGVPVLLRGDAGAWISQNEDSPPVDVSGVWCPLPAEFARSLGGNAGIPRGCILVDEPEDIKPVRHGDAEPVDHRGAYWRLFEFQDVQTGLWSAGFSYAQFQRVGPYDLSWATNWVHDYIVRRYNGRGLTNCDEHEPQPGVELPLGGVMAGAAEAHRVEAALRRIEQAVSSTRGDYPERVARALVDAFNQEELEFLVRDALHLPLERIAGRHNGTAEQILELIDYCERHGRLAELVGKMLEGRPGLANLANSDIGKGF